MMRPDPELIQPDGELIAQLSDILKKWTVDILGLEQFMKRKTVAKDRRCHRRLMDIDKPPKRDQDDLCRSIEAFPSNAS